jgi:hypothetical protein
MSNYEIKDEDVSCPYCGIVFDGMCAESELLEHLEKSEECKKKYQAQLESLSKTVEKKENKDRISQIKARLEKKILIRLQREHPYLIHQISVNPEILDRMVDNELFFSALKTKDARKPTDLPIGKKILKDQFREIKKTAKEIGLKLTDEKAQKWLMEDYEDYQDKPKENDSEKLSKEATEKEEILIGIASLSKEEEEELLKRFLKRTMKRN